LVIPRNCSHSFKWSNHIRKCYSVYHRNISTVALTFNYSVTAAVPCSGTDLCFRRCETDRDSDPIQSSVFSRYRTYGAFRTSYLFDINREVANQPGNYGTAAAPQTISLYTITNTVTFASVSSGAAPLFHSVNHLPAFAPRHPRYRCAGLVRCGTIFLSLRWPAPHLPNDGLPLRLRVRFISGIITTPILSSNI